MLPSATDPYLDGLSRSLPPRQEAVLRHRWAELLPAVTLWAAQKRRPTAAADLAPYARRHRTAALVCLSRGLPWPTIRRYRLDDPRRDDAELLGDIEAAVKRRNERPGRIQRTPRSRKPKEAADGRANAS
jgi:hypothetical protein